MDFNDPNNILTVKGVIHYTINLSNKLFTIPLIFQTTLFLINFVNLKILHKLSKSYLYINFNFTEFIQNDVILIN